MLWCALEEYVRKTGGHITKENRKVEVILPVIVEEVPGGIQFRLKGRIENEYYVIEECITMYQGESHKIKPIDLENWANYVNEHFSYACT